MNLFAKIRDAAHRHLSSVKRAVVTAAICAMSVICGVTAFAAESGASDMSSVRSQLKSSATSVVDDIMGTITDILPVVLLILGAMLVIGIGISVVKKLTKKSSAG